MRYYFTLSFHMASSTTVRSGSENPSALTEIFMRSPGLPVVVSVAACGTLLFFLFVPPQAPPCPIALKPVRIDLGRLRPGDTVPFQAFLENHSDQSAEVFVETTCDCVVSGSDHSSVGSGKKASFDFVLTTPEPVTGGFGTTPMRKQLRFFDRNSGNVLLGEVTADIEKPFIHAIDAFRFNTFSFSSAVRGSVDATDVHSTVIGVVPSTTNVQCVFPSDVVAAQVVLNRDHHSARIAIEAPIVGPSGTAEHQGTLIWSGRASPDQSETETLRFPIKLQIRTVPPLRVEPQFAVISPGDDVSVRVVPTQEDVRVRILPASFSLPDDVTLTDCGDDWAKLHFENNAEASKPSSATRATGRVDVTLTKRQFEVATPVSFPLLLLCTGEPKDD